MKKYFKTLILIIVLIPLTACTNDKVEFQLNADNISMIELYDVSSPNGQLLFRLSADKNIDKIKEFAELFNNSNKYTDDVGTTHPNRVEIILNDGKKINFGYGTQRFITVSDGESQFNMKNMKLERMMNKIIRMGTNLDAINSYITIEELLGEKINDIDEINTNYRGHVTSIDFIEEINMKLDNLNSVYLKSTTTSYEDAEHFFTFSLIQDNETVMELSADITSEWIGYNG